MKIVIFVVSILWSINAVLEPGLVCTNSVSIHLDLTRSWYGLDTGLVRAWSGLGVYLVCIKKKAIPSFYNLFFYICPYIFGGIAVETRLLYRNLAMSFAFSLSESAGSFYP